MAKWLRVTEQPPIAPGKETADHVPANNEIKIVTLNSDSAVVGKKIVDLHFPSSTYITLIKRNDQYIQPTGADRLMAGDRLLVLSGNEESYRKRWICFLKNKKCLIQLTSMLILLHIPNITIYETIPFNFIVLFYYSVSH
jgi:NhaP-type Na+/H+ and K+/H+ antiporter